jgi:hypothetical protein
MRSRIAADSSLFSSLGQFFVLHGRNLDMKIDPVEQRTGDARKGNAGSVVGCNCIRAEDLRKNRKGVDSNFGAERELG